MGKEKTETLVNRQRAFFHTGETLDYRFRKQQLTLLKNMLNKYEKAIYHAGFDTFSHQKSILKQTTKFDIPFRYPSGKLGKAVVKRLMT